MVEELRKVFEKHAGTSPIELAYMESGKSRKVRTAFGVKPSDELRLEIENILGPGTVK